MTGIGITGLSKTFSRGLTAIEHIDLETPKGSFLSLLGPSGCGKSTTLRILAGLETASAGQVVIDGRDVTRLPPAERGIAMVFQSYALFPHLSVAENIVFGLRVRKVPDRDAKLARVAALQPADLAAHLATQLRVQVRERLVHQAHRRLGDDRAAQGHALLLAAGKLRGLALQELTQSQQLRHAREPRLAVRHFAHAQPEDDVLGDR